MKKATISEFRKKAYKANQKLSATGYSVSILGNMTPKGVEIAIFSPRNYII